MSEDPSVVEPTDVVRQLHDAIAQGQYEQVEDLLDDDVVWHLEGDDEFAGTYTGKSAVVAALRREQQQAPIELSQVSDEEPDVVGFAFAHQPGTMVTVHTKSDCGDERVGSHNTFLVNNQKITQFGSILGGQMSF